ncbi:UDP-N-acetylglucosamine 2-epimerase [Desulfosporosinus sp. BICA1-9]|uniref:UDP-N-acetylglucosamine 2-epimerase n=1 Tax=Desulfosporosinus sp. BICA1-9 TaxID=1531958 RepID=UPI00054C46AA|nr:UDP-N-acetylglucosamine 2-epimerase [Desulfosporosinus sp. BICA1-9]KJS47411.1 MAG: UDP-N-acetylglucosamine 2-epimerase [Peptococcaceae bacterium BRH_c23]KJS89853.1 MAG: UDP-N-acetylglucosamine 2-epimerase [Desulfosporosinus sp. BICA1-9]HBW34976.1 UDP-N-acetylglucosamine 2-epimerase (hydrolyzing) [Desulfosporosinus sp.]
MKKSICIVTGSRAEYGLLSPIIKQLIATNSFELKIVATGTHLSEDFGLTYQEIEADGISVNAKIDVLQNDDSNKAMSKALGIGVIGFAEYFEKNQPDMVVVLGDRFEIFAAATAAAVACIPIAHLHGGETTVGAVDEFFRHSITKMSYLHFTSTEQYRQRIINMGEAPDRVFNVGATGVENILSMPLMAKDELARIIDFDLNSPYALVTFHPVTLERNTAIKQIEELLSALDETSGLNYIFTKANADANGRAINNKIDTYCKKKGNAIAFTSMGVLRYLSAMKYCAMVIGNSSSGIIETPSFKKPTINIGDRQKGRICAKSVITCEAEKRAIIKSINKARSQQFLQGIANQVNPYGNGKTSEKIVALIKDFLDNDKINLKKSFYDVRG